MSARPRVRPCPDPAERGGCWRLQRLRVMLCYRARRDGSALGPVKSRLGLRGSGGAGAGGSIAASPGSGIFPQSLSCAKSSPPAPAGMPGMLPRLPCAGRGTEPPPPANRRFLCSSREEPAEKTGSGGGGWWFTTFFFLFCCVGAVGLPGARQRLRGAVNGARLPQAGLGMREGL